MQYRLGKFRVTIDVHSLLVARTGSESERLAQTLRLASQSAVVGEPPMERMLSSAPVPQDRDILAALPRGSADREWLSATLDAMSSTSANTRVLLHACEHGDGPDGGSITIVGCAPERASAVRATDRVTAGFVVSSARAGEVEIAPRIYRIVCTNGAVIPIGRGRAEVVPHAMVHAAVHECMQGRVSREVTARFERAAATPVSDADAILRGARARSLAVRREVREEFERAGDATVWGLINAVTAVARGAPTWAQRVERERDAARILAWIERPASTRTGPVALAQRKPKIAATQ